MTRKILLSLAVAIGGWGGGGLDLVPLWTTLQLSVKKSVVVVGLQDLHLHWYGLEHKTRGGGGGGGRAGGGGLGLGGGGGLELRSFWEGHPGVTGHAAHQACDPDMRPAPAAPGRQASAPCHTSPKPVLHSHESTSRAPSRCPTQPAHTRTRRKHESPKPALHSH